MVCLRAQGMTWSTSEVLAQTLQHAQHSGMCIAPLDTLPRLQDIDTFEDLCAWHATLQLQQSAGGHVPPDRKDPEHVPPAQDGKHQDSGHQSHCAQPHQDQMAPGAAPATGQHHAGQGMAMPLGVCCQQHNTSTGTNMGVLACGQDDGKDGAAGGGASVAGGIHSTDSAAVVVGGGAAVAGWGDPVAGGGCGRLELPSGEWFERLRLLVDGLVQEGACGDRSTVSGL